MKILTLFSTFILLTAFTCLVAKSVQIKKNHPRKFSGKEDTISHTFLFMNKFYVLTCFIILSISFLFFLFALHLRFAIIQDTHILSLSIVILISILILLVNYDEPTSSGHYAGVGVFFAVGPLFLLRVSSLISLENEPLGIIGWGVIIIGLLTTLSLEIFLKIKSNKERPPVFGYLTELMYTIVPVIWIFVNSIFLILE